MDKFQNQYNINSHRLKDFDYASNGAYFITICTKDRKNLFGEIIDEEMVLNYLGKITAQCWQNISQHFPHIKIDEFIIMPNHIHGILWIDWENVETNNYSSRKKKILKSQKNSSSIHDLSPKKTNNYSSLLNGTTKTIGSAIRGFKIGVTKYAKNNTNIETVWQSNYYDHIIRNQESFLNITQYILDNPKMWEHDKNNPVGLKI